MESVSLGGWVSAPPPAPPPSLGTTAAFATRPHKLKLNQLWPASRGVQGGGSLAGAGSKGQGVCGPFWEGRLQLTLKAVNVTRGLLCCARAAWVSCVLCAVLCCVLCCAVCGQPWMPGAGPTARGPSPSHPSLRQALRPNHHPASSTRAPPR